MGRVLSNNTTLQYAIELTEEDPSKIGILPGEQGEPGTPTWYELEPNSFGTIGAEITTVARDPISKNRQRRKGTITDLDSSADFEQDLTLSAYEDFAEGFVFSKFVGAGSYLSSDVAAPSTYLIPGTEGAPALAERTLINAVGFDNAANNGLKLVDVGSATTAIVIVDTDLVSETPTLGAATVEVAGFRTAAGDLDVDVTSNPGQIVISSTAGVFNSPGLDITIGSAIFFGGDNAINRFSNAENVGFVRVVSIPDANTLICDKPRQDWVDETSASQEVDLYVGRFLRNVPVDNSDFLERSFQLEIGYDNLANNPAGPEYEYSIGNYCNTLTFNLPLTDKALLNPTFIGLDTQPPTPTRKANADTPIPPDKTTAFNTTQDCARLRVTEVDGTGITTDFKNLTLTLNNNVSPEKVLCVLGARFMNYGNFEVNAEMQVLFTNSRVIEAIRNNDTVAMEFAIQNDNGVIFVEIPSMTLGGGGKDFPVNESVLVNLTGTAFQDETLGYSVGMTSFTYVPAFASGGINAANASCCKI